MKKYIHVMFPNDRIFIENDEGWFIDRCDNRLYRWIPSTGFCEYVVSLPETGTYRLSSSCMRYTDKIICLPDRGKCIWIYDLKQGIFNGIEIENPNSVRLGMVHYWKSESILWVWSDGLKCLMEIDLDNDRISNCYRITEDINERFAWEVIKSGIYIYLFGAESSTIYEFDTISKKTGQYEIQGIGKDLDTFCFDGTLFWFSGTTERIYTWNKKTKELNCYTDFPQNFRVVRNGQKKIFSQSVCLDEYVCFIPLNSLETPCSSILFVDKKNYQMKCLRICDEGLKENGLYSLEYIISGRYIGIYYEYNDYISEIDIRNFLVKEKKMAISMDSYVKVLREKSIYEESRDGDLDAFILSIL